MRQSFTLVSILVLAVAGAVGATEVVAPDAVEPGTAGVCITEMDGGELVEIPVTVIGSLGPTGPEREIVLIRLEDPRYEKTGIIAGMSGSPVYVEGRLLGALAFGWAFAKEPIGGVTPFSRMQQLGPATGDVGGAGGGRRPELDEMLVAGREGRLGSVLVDWLVPAPRTVLHRLPVTVSLGGWWSPIGSEWLAEGWRRLGWVAAPGGAAASGSTSGPLRPGAMVAAVMVDGDAVLAAGGTVTEIRGDQIWAFGHPFLGAGDVDMPLARARVLTVLPSQAESFKFFQVGETIGALRSDRTHGVWGELGSPASMVPVVVTVDGHEYSFRSLRHPVLMPLITSYLTQASLTARGRAFGNQTVALEIEVEYPGGLRAELSETYASGQAPQEAAAMVGAAVGYLENSPFEGPEVERVRIRLNTSERLETATVVDATPERVIVKPGEALGVRLRLRPVQGDEYTRLTEIPIPPQLPEGRVDLVVADGASWTVYDLQMRPTLPASFDDELGMFERLVPSSRVVLALERRQTGVSLEGGSVSLPPSLVVQLRSALGPNLKTWEYGVVGRVEEAMPTSVLGAQRIPLTVRLRQE
jgi:hypothetical protein